MSRTLAYAQLVRLPNVFTAFADIGLGTLVLWSLHAVPPWPAVLALVASSGCLYSAGMTWNDYFDVEQDRRERPFRPLPSGRIALVAAARLGTLLLILGVVFAALAGGSALLVAALLVAAILLYDGWLRRTPLGPVAMGVCRFLNVLLGVAPAGADVLPWGTRLHLAAAVGVYIVGVTWFARTEARRSSQGALTGAAVVMLLALLVALALPVWFAPATASPLFPYLLVAFGFLIGLPISRAVITTQPKHVQAAVKRAVLGLVVLDAVLATAIVGVVGLVLIVLLLPALYLGRWLYST